MAKSKTPVPSGTKTSSRKITRPSKHNYMSESQGKTRNGTWYKKRDPRMSYYVFYQNLQDTQPDFYDEVNSLFNGENLVGENGNSYYSAKEDLSLEHLIEHLDTMVRNERKLEQSIIKEHFWDANLKIEDLAVPANLLKFFNIMQQGKEKFEDTVKILFEENKNGETYRAKVGLGEFMITGTSGMTNKETVLKDFENSKKQIGGYLTKRLNEEINRTIVDCTNEAIQHLYGASLASNDPEIINKALVEILNGSTELEDDIRWLLTFHLDDIMDNALHKAIEDTLNKRTSNSDQYFNNDRSFQDLIPYMDKIFSDGASLVQKLKKVYWDDTAREALKESLDSYTSQYTDSIKSTSSWSQLKRTVQNQLSRTIKDNKELIAGSITMEAKKKGVAQEYFNQFIYDTASEETKKAIKKLRNQLKKASAKGIKRETDFLSAKIEEFELKEDVGAFKRSSIHTGDINNMSADVMYIYGIDSDIFNEKLGEAYEEVRQAIAEGKGTGKVVKGSVAGENTMIVRNLYSKWRRLQKFGYVVMSSDKLSSNYKDSNFQGFMARQAMTMKNYQKKYAGAHMKQKGSYLISAVINSMEGAIFEGNTSAVENGLAAAIATFLFDDLQIVGTDQFELSNNVYTIHVMNIEQLYVPLSIVLELLKQAFEDVNKEIKRLEISDIVNVNLQRGKAASIAYPTGNPEESFEWSQDDWKAQRDIALKNTTVEIRIAKKFEQLMKGDTGLLSTTGARLTKFDF